MDILLLLFNGGRLHANWRAYCRVTGIVQYLVPTNALGRIVSICSANLV